MSWRIAVARSIVLAALSLAAGLAAGISGCGGGGPAVSCGKTQPCGGSPVGHWTIATYCTNTTAPTTDAGTGACAGTGIDVGAVTESGTVTFNADMTFQEQAVSDGSFKFIYSAACLASLNLTCAQIQQSIMSMPMTGTSGQSTSCTGASDCTCTVTLSQQSTNRQGTYAVDGTNLTLSPSVGTTETDPYCVQGNVLHAMTVDMSMNMGAMGMATIKSDLVLTK